MVPTLFNTTTTFWCGKNCQFYFVLMTPDQSRNLENAPMWSREQYQIILSVLTKDSETTCEEAMVGSGGHKLNIYSCQFKLPFINRNLKFQNF